ncbi:MAG: hypothetical protein KC468_16170 [Myxococcales bacterium]|nr:hypothetical protein [Myxococcales bacterium]
MSRKSITLFMWGYQPHYRYEVKRRMNNVMAELGIEGAGADCLLVGAMVPGESKPHDVCVEPEDGKWPLEIFDGLLIAIEAEVREHPLQNMYFGDEPSMRDKPENIRRDSVRKAVQATLATYDSDNEVRSFAGRPAPVEGYYVVPILQLPEAIFHRFPPLNEPITDGHLHGSPSLIHSAVAQVLNEAHDELLRPDPGRFSGRSRSAEEIVRRAAADFMHTPVLAIGTRNYGGADLFERFNLISSLMYEGTEGTGRMLLANPNGSAVDVRLEISEPVPFRQPRWARKVLQMASAETALIADCENILGLGTVADGVDPMATQDVFMVEFHDHFHWSLCCGEQVLLVSRYGVPALPQERFPRNRLVDTFRRLFDEATDDDVDAFTALFDTAVAQRHGSMLVVARDAADEAERLRSQGTRVAPVKLSPSLYRRVSDIDGTIIVDPHCVCHAIGVILDGPARPECTPSRGSRYNSGIRYVGASEVPRLAVVVSDDRTVDVIPVLRPRVARSTIEEQLAQLESSSRDNYHPAINWLDRHRFYLNESQCGRVNAALDRIRGEPMEVGEIMIQWHEFSPNPGLTEDYFEVEQ